MTKRTEAGWPVSLGTQSFGASGQNTPRAIAEAFRVSETDRQSLLKIAEEYEQIAIRAEQWHAASETSYCGHRRQEDH
jgi:hypothetical protein